MWSKLAPRDAQIAELARGLRARTPSAIAIDGFRKAAVLMPLVAQRVGLALLLIERTADLPWHASQVAFPGGGLDAGDADLESCAVREANEELALPGAAVELLGRLDDVPTPSGFVITPVVGFLAAEPTIVANPREVASYFYAPLERLRDPAAYEEHGEREFRGISYRLFGYRCDGHLIWGATARMIKQLLELLPP